MMKFAGAKGKEGRTVVVDFGKTIGAQTLLFNQ